MMILDIFYPKYLSMLIKIKNKTENNILEESICIVNKKTANIPV